MSYYTGRYPSRHGATWNRVPLSVNEITLGEYLAGQGRDLALAGKTHVIPDKAGMERLAIDGASELGILLNRGGFVELDRYDGHHEPGPRAAIRPSCGVTATTAPIPGPTTSSPAWTRPGRWSAAGTCAMCICLRAWPRRIPRPPT